MYLKKISLLNFKNIAQEELALCPGINCLVGDNGAGKTNVIDAVYYLSMCKSSLTMTDGQSVRHGADFFLAEGQYLTDAGKTESVVCSFSRKGGKVLKRNGKEYERLSDHVGLIPAVIVSPADSALISDAADERRRYLNGFISQLDRTYRAAVCVTTACWPNATACSRTCPTKRCSAFTTCNSSSRATEYTPCGGSSRNGCNPSSRTITAPSRATASRSNCTTSRS